MTHGAAEEIVGNEGVKGERIYFSLPTAEVIFDGLWNPFPG